MYQYQTECNACCVDILTLVSSNTLMCALSELLIIYFEVDPDLVAHTSGHITCYLDMLNAWVCSEVKKA